MSTGKPTATSSPEGAIFANFISSSKELEDFDKARATLSVLSKKLRKTRQDLLVECVYHSARNCPEFQVSPEISASMDPKELVEFIARRKGFLRQGILVKSVIYASETVPEYRNVIDSEFQSVKNEMERAIRAEKKRKRCRIADGIKTENA